MSLRLTRYRPCLEDMHVPIFRCFPFRGQSLNRCLGGGGMPLPAQFNLSCFSGRPER